jgi:uncharacterized phage protein (TIGR02218 family)
VVDWETCDHASLYSGAIAAIGRDGAGFTAQLQSAKADLDIDPVPRASPSCRARFCGPGCGLSAFGHTVRMAAAAIDHDANTATFDIAVPQDFVRGELRWLDGPQTGLAMTIVARRGAALELGAAIDPAAVPGHRALLRQGCDKTVATCAARFGNAVNFQGEPHLPGNDLLTQYPQPR